MHRKREGNLLIYFPTNGLHFHTYLSKAHLSSDQNVNTSKFSAVIIFSVWLSHYHFRFLLQTNTALSEVWLASVCRCQWIPSWILWPRSRNYKMTLCSHLRSAECSYLKLSVSSSAIFSRFLSAYFAFWPRLLSIRAILIC